MQIFKSQLTYVLLWSTFICFVSCDFNSGSRPGHADYEGMIYIPAKGKSFTMGSALAGLPSDTKPEMEVSFAYNFHLQEKEVTQADFQELMGYGQIAEQAQHPIHTVNWFEAIYYCNQKSLSMGLDTVYQYSGVNTDANGRITSLDGVVTLFTVEGVRLATEAEWEYVAKKNEIDLSTSAWTNVNAEGRTHQVGQLQKGTLGFYDLQGNVMEWVQDWKGPYFANPVLNFLGNSTSNSTQERIVKGGSFAHNEKYAHPSSRSDIYPVSSNTRTSYIGFRTAIGVIPEGNYLDESGILIGDNTTQISTSKSKINSLIPAKAKLVFVNKVTGNIQWIDFSKSSLNLSFLSDEEPSFHPTISPSGEYIAYSTKIEGATGESKVFVRKLNTGASKIALNVPSAYIPRWWEDPTNGKTYLIYSTDGISNSNKDSWESSSTWKILFENDSFPEAPTQIVTQGSYHGGIDSTGQFLASGYTQLKTLDLGIQKSKDLFLSPQNGKDSEGSTQVCNVSVKPKGKPELLFIDFGSKDSSSLIGSSYRIHEYLFRTDDQGDFLQAYQVPKGENGWDHPEWSNHQDFAVATTTNSNEDHHAIYLINLKDSSYTLLVEGDNLWHPYLWVEGPIANPDELDLNKLGIYNEPVINSTTRSFSYAMHHFWNKKLNLDGVILGSSRAQDGVNPTYLDGQFLNMGLPGASVTTMKNILEAYIIPHTPKVKNVIISIDVDALQSDGNIWNLGPGLSTGFQYDEENNFWKDSLPVNFTNLMNSASYDEEMESLLTQDGFHHTGTCDGFGPKDPAIAHENPWNITYPDYTQNINQLHALIQLSAQKNIHVTGVIFPLAPGYKNSRVYGLYGPVREDSYTILNHLEELATTYDNFTLVDENKFGDHDYTDEHASNHDHLCPEGAKKLTLKLDSILKTY